MPCSVAVPQSECGAVSVLSWLKKLFPSRPGSAEATHDASNGEELPVPERLIVGLGNPGKKYEGTRHNVGFLVVDRLAARKNVALFPNSRWRAQVAQAEGALLVKPLTFMNESGKAVQLLSAYYKIPPESCLVVYDDTALPFGRLRIRRGGSAGGHNGMKSVIACLGTQEFPRVRFGVGEAGGRDLAGHVLGNFTRAESSELPVCVEDAADAIDCICARGIDDAMAEWNGKARDST